MKQKKTRGPSAYSRLKLTQELFTLAQELYNQSCFAHPQAHPAIMCECCRAASNKIRAVVLKETRVGKSPRRPKRNAG